MMLNFRAQNFSYAGAFKFFLFFKNKYFLIFILLTLCSLIGFLKLSQSRSAIESLEKQIRSRQLEANSSTESDGGNSPERRFFQFSSLENLTLVSGDMQRFGTQNGVAVSGATFKPVGDLHNKDIGRMEINARLKGPYPALKKTVTELLAGHEDLALEAMSVHRDRATDTVVDGDLRLTFFYRKHLDAATP